MGELSAKHLRGDNMEDVIFNGSTARKPVGTRLRRARVRQLPTARSAAPYASYSEISLKRVVSRDGASTYFINGAPLPAQGHHATCSSAPAWARAATRSSSRA